MSFINLSTMVAVRKEELENKVQIVIEKCNEASRNIDKIKTRAQHFISDMKCDDLTSLKNTFIQYVTKCEEFKCLLTEFNLSVYALDIMAEQTPDVNVPKTNVLPFFPSWNSEGVLKPSVAIETPSECSKIEHKVRKHSKIAKSDLLISFCSDSEESSAENDTNDNSANSISNIVEQIQNLTTHDHSTDKHVLTIDIENDKLQMCNENNNNDNILKLERRSVVNDSEEQEQATDNNNHNKLTIQEHRGFVNDTGEPQQTTFSSNANGMVAEEINLSDVDHVTLENDELMHIWYLPPQPDSFEINDELTGTIAHVSEPNIWIITNMEKFHKLYKKIGLYYSHNVIKLHSGKVLPETYCTYYDEVENDWPRCYIVKVTDNVKAELYLVDIGDTVEIGTDKLYPLANEFCDVPPLAYCSYLSGCELINNSDEVLPTFYDLLIDFKGQPCSMLIKEMQPGSLGIIVRCNNVDLNQLLINEGLAVRRCDPIDIDSADQPPTSSTPNEDITYEEMPEYEDVLEAVTGYHNKDEGEICRFYKGGPDRSCFKGTRCKKKHVVIHPDGWTLDKTPVMANAPVMDLPAPDTWVTVRVTCVGHYNKVFLHIVNKETNIVKPPHRFGVILPPTDLDELILNMNTQAARCCYKPLEMMPAIGEVVAAIYPPDNKWYRGRVLSMNSHEQTVEVQYLDYGNRMWLQENFIAKLDPLNLMLPFQAILATLAGYTVSDTTKWGNAKRALSNLVLDKELEAQILSRSYNSLEVYMTDKAGYSIAEQLASSKLVTLTHYQVRKESQSGVEYALP